MICSFSFSQKKKIDSAYYYFKQAKNYDFKNSHFLAYENYIKSLNIYKEINYIDSIAKCNLELFELIESQSNLNKDAKPYLDEYYKYALKRSDSFKLLKAYNRFAEYYWDNNNISKSRMYYFKALKTVENSKLKQYKANIYANLAYLYTKKKPDSAKIFFEKTLTNVNKNDKNLLFGNYINYAIFFQQQKKFSKAIALLNKAKEIEPTAYKLKYYKILYNNFAKCYKEIGDYKKAYEAYEKYNTYRDSLNNTTQNIAISDLDKKYQTEKKEKQILQLEKENLETESKRIKNRNLLIGSLLFILFTGTIGILSLKNSKRKRKLLEQDKELEKQKNLTLLKEQELTTINAMVDGQEKERKRIAEDLHDNLGSVLATLKLHFENLQMNKEKKKINQEELFNKTENLIDEAYLKVRSIAHAKNAGVIANQGLLSAIEMMAEKIAVADKINIDVIDFGLDKPLENSLEITTFRIIQELITNVLKHAEAKNITINISLYDNDLQIIIEDDGKGFDANAIDSKKGMGITSIETRISHLNGTFEIDSTFGKGTSVLINIPLK
ncbi:tetratricopeptide repeat-containing sensor histidine kinase [Polaribacter aestuariivivens]|nr:ATP-binding protein [Polaribacter aestuariivivens]